MTDPSLPQAYGGPGWQPRKMSSREEMGRLWGSYGLDSEWRPLRSVLLHRPGPELAEAAEDPGSSLMLSAPDPVRAGDEHDGLARAYREKGVAVHFADPPGTPTPNQLFAADLMAMTPQGAIVGRPASETRAGEERWVARALGMMGIPILRSVSGRGVFEGADLIWLREDLALLASGLRTNGEGGAQVATTLKEMGVEVDRATLPPGTMHLMGQLRILDRDLAVGWPGGLPPDGAAAVEKAGFALHFIPDEEEARKGFALNVVTLGPRKILMPAGNPATRAFYEALGVECTPVEVGELGKAGGSIGCLTAVLQRDMG